MSRDHDPDPDHLRVGSSHGGNTSWVNNQVNRSDSLGFTHPDRQTNRPTWIALGLIVIQFWFSLTIYLMVLLNWPLIPENSTPTMWWYKWWCSSSFAAFHAYSTTDMSNILSTSTYSWLRFSNRAWYCRDRPVAIGDSSPVPKMDSVRP